MTSASAAPCARYWPTPGSATHHAAEVGLSVSRFLHLFPATAASFRRYRRWARMLRVAGGLERGLHFTRAATEAGFSSANHFSDASTTCSGSPRRRCSPAG